MLFKAECTGSEKKIYIFQDFETENPATLQTLTSLKQEKYFCEN